MNDDELVAAFVQQLQDHTAQDAPSFGLTQTLSGLPVRQHRQFLVPVGAAAAVASLATGGVLVTQLGGSGGLAAGSPAVAASPSALASNGPSAVSASPVASAPPAAEVSPSALAGSPEASASPTPLRDPAKLSSVSPIPVKGGGPAAPTTTAATTTSRAAGAPAPAGATDDRAALAAASAYSVRVTTVQDVAHPAAKTVSVEAYQHDQEQVFYAGRTPMDWDQLQALPTDLPPFIADVKAAGSPPNAVEKGATELPLEGPMPLQLRKNAVAMVESAPQATTLSGAHDHLGRPATRVRVNVDNILDDYYFDPVSYRLLESGEIFTAAWRADFDTSGGQSPDDFTNWYSSYGDWTITP